MIYILGDLCLHPSSYGGTVVGGHFNHLQVDVVLKINYHNHEDGQVVKYSVPNNSSPSVSAMHMNLFLTICLHQK